MGVQVNIARAKARLSELIALAESGEEVVISRAGKPVVTLTPTPRPANKRKRVLGMWAHLGPMDDPDLFFRPDPEIEAWMDKPIDPET